MSKINPAPTCVCGENDKNGASQMRWAWNSQQYLHAIATLTWYSRKTTCTFCSWIQFAYLWKKAFSWTRKIFYELWNPENWLCLGNGDYLVAGAYLKMISYLNLITHNLSYQFLVLSSITNMYISVEKLRNLFWISGIPLGQLKEDEDAYSALEMRGECQETILKIYY